ncbi:MAG TPA: Wzz/FepE/Etk N-terminal domain-containing protein, partial [Candidatus Cloacimonadota bacterium]|nr:Wzz/FepE/Etk N-terminal domain-containing protein [Candidatus Cloacimonadota bacterium]
MENQLSQAPIQDEIKLSDYLRIILQYRYLVVLVFTLVLVATIFYTARQPKIYSASARILLEDQKGNTDLMFLATPGVGKNTLNNQIELIRSKPIMTLAWEIMKKYPDWDTFPANLSASPAGTLGRMKVESKRETDILTISFESTNQTEAMAAVNSIAEAIQQQNTQYARLEFTTIREFLETQLDAISRRLQSSENDLREFKNLNKLTELTTETQKLIELSSELEAEYESSLTDQAVKAKTLDMLNRQLREQDSLLVDVGNILKAPYINELRKQIVDTQALITKLVTKNEYPLDHPQILLLKREMENAKATLDLEVRKLVSLSVNNDPLQTRNDLLAKIVQASIELEMARAKVDGLEQTTD